MKQRRSRYIDERIEKRVAQGVRVLGVLLLNNVRILVRTIHVKIGACYVQQKRRGEKRCNQAAAS